MFVGLEMLLDENGGRFFGECSFDVCVVFVLQESCRYVLFTRRESMLDLSKLMEINL